MWESKYQQLVELVGPFKTQLEQYSVERETLMEQKNTTQQPETAAGERAKNNHMSRTSRK